MPHHGASVFRYQMVRSLRKLGLIAGGGRLPAVVRSACEQDGRPLYICALTGFCEPETVRGAAHGWYEMAQAGALIEGLHAAGVQDVVLCGRVTRPDFARLIPDWKGVLLLPKLGMAALRGDDFLLRTVVEILEAEGFRLCGVNDVVANLLAPVGALSERIPDESQLSDIRIGVMAARRLGSADVGQAVVVAGGQVIGEEDRAGTDAMLARLGRRAAGGVLVKCAKPQQERRVDLPAVGVETMINAAAISLAGVAVEAGAALIVDMAATRDAADASGLFLFGVSGDV